MNSVVGDYITQRTEILMTGAALKILGAAPDRCVLAVGNGGGLGATVIDIVPPRDSSTGFSLSNQQPNQVFTSRLHPGLIWQEWWCWGPNTNRLVVIEVFYRPR